MAGKLYNKIKRTGTFSNKQKRAYNVILTGLKIAKKTGQKSRFLTLTTSEEQAQIENYQPSQLNESWRKFKQIIRRTTVQDLIKLGHIKTSQIRKYYPNKPLNETLTFEYIKIITNEGNGVIHCVYNGDYIPYNYIVEIWRDIHNSWEVNIQLIRHTLRDLYNSAAYVVSQYVAGQGSSYQRASTSWKWIVRGYRKKYNEFFINAKNRFYYNPWERKYYYKRLEVRIFELWEDTLVNNIKSIKNYLEPPPNQLKLSAFY